MIKIWSLELTCTSLLDSLYSFSSLSNPCFCLVIESIRSCRREFSSSKNLVRTCSMDTIRVFSRTASSISDSLQEIWLAEKGHHKEKNLVINGWEHLTETCSKSCWFMNIFQINWQIIYHANRDSNLFLIIIIFKCIKSFIEFKKSMCTA